MKLYKLEREQWVDRPLQLIFPFFERPENLALITPPSLNFHLLTPSPVKMEQGRIIDYSIRLLGVRTRWRSIISTYEPPYCFVDEQLIGPYSFWHHTHRFKQDGNGTLIFDEVRYALPIYLPQPLSTVLQRWHIHPTLEHIFNYRRDQFMSFFAPATDDSRVRQNDLLLEN